MPKAERPIDSFVTVIIPCYNYGHFLPASLESVLQQTYAHWECIVVDDGSTDDTKEVVAAFAAKDKRFKYIYQSNKGMSAARNAGIKAASGEFLQFLDSDDLIERRKLEVQAAFLKEHPEVDVVYGDARFFPSDEPQKLFYSIDGKNTRPRNKVSGGRDSLLKYMLVDNIFVISAPLLRQEVPGRCGWFDEGLRALEDWDFWLRCLECGVQFRFLEAGETFTLIRYHRQSVSKDRTAMLRANVLLRTRMHASLNDGSLQALNLQGLGNARIALAVEMMRRGQRWQGVSDLMTPDLIKFKLVSLCRRLKACLAAVTRP